MLSFIKGRQWLQALAYFIRHPFSVVSLTIVRRYVDAQGHYIGELYVSEVEGTLAHMIGATCDNLPLNADIATRFTQPVICYSYSFLDPLPANTARIGAFEPSLNAIVQEYIALRRFNRMRVIVHNRFVEHVMGLPV